MLLRDRDPDETSGDSPGAAATRDSWREDLELVQAARTHERAALDRFIKRMCCVPRFVALLDGRSVQPLEREAREDLVQDVLAIVWRRLGDYRGEAALETWVFRICDFQLRNARRHAAPRRAVSLEDLGEPSSDRAEPDHDHELLGRGIDGLPAAEAEILRLKHYDGLTFDQIATQLRQSPNTVKTRYYRGLESLRRWLQMPEGGR